MKSFLGHSGYLSSIPFAFEPNWLLKKAIDQHWVITFWPHKPSMLVEVIKSIVSSRIGNEEAPWELLHIQRPIYTDTHRRFVKKPSVQIHQVLSRKKALGWPLHAFIRFMLFKKLFFLYTPWSEIFISFLQYFWAVESTKCNPASHQDITM